MTDTDPARGASTSTKGRKKASTSRTILEYLVLAVVAITVALLIQAYLVKPYRIPSASMETTLMIGDRVLVDRISWRFGDPQRDQIAVFHPPFAGPVLIKRIIGLPGDTLSVRDGKLYINGKQADEPYVRKINGVPVPTEPFSNGMAWSLQQPYKVPAGSYFMMGDNRIDSGDSREFGPVPRGQFVGHAFARYWPIGRIGGIS
jgi:signal peptidase I